jgi:3-oxoacyl-[acyl-carrier-protein] synthase II
MGVKTPAGNTPEGAFKSLLAGNSLAQLMPALMPADSGGDPPFIGCSVPDIGADRYFSQRQARRLSPVTRLGFAAAIDAIEDANLELRRGDDRCGIMVGIGGASLIASLEETTRRLDAAPRPDVPPYVVPMIMPNATAAALSIHCGLTGPALTYSTSCASGTNAIGEAMLAIRAGMIDVAIAGGAETPLTPAVFRGFGAARALTRRCNEPGAASRPFDADRDGFVLAEGAAFLVLERWEKARARGARIYAELAGYATNSDAYNIVAPREDGSAAARCMRAALTDAGVEPSDVGHVNAHGTSTVYNDRAESQAIRECFGDVELPVTAPKGVVGHMIGAAGAFEAVVATLSITRGLVPPVANHHHVDADQPIRVVAGEPLRVQPAPAISNSFGFGGHNACLVLSPA